MLENHSKTNDFNDYLQNLLKEQNKQIDINDKSSLKEGILVFSDIYVDMYFNDEIEDKTEDIDKDIEMITELHLKGDFPIFISGNNEVIVSPSAKKLDAYQVTYFDKKGAISDSTKETLDETIRYLRESSIYPIRKSYVEYLTPEGVANMTQKNNAPVNQAQALSKDLKQKQAKSAFKRNYQLER